MGEGGINTVMESVDHDVPDQAVHSSSLGDSSLSSSRNKGQSGKFPSPAKAAQFMLCLYVPLCAPRECCQSRDSHKKGY